VSLHEEVGQWGDINSYVGPLFTKTGQCEDGERRTGNSSSRRSLNELVACETLLQSHVVLTNDLEQVPMGILPTGHTASVYAFEYYEGFERIA